MNNAEFLENAEYEANRVINENYVTDEAHLLALSLLLLIDVAESLRKLTDNSKE